MSRWVTSFNSHQFHSTWETLKEKLSKLNIDEITDENILQEVARLNKVIEFIDKYLKLIDPDINISNFANILNNLNQYATSIINELNTFISNKNIAYIQRANNHIDNCLNTIKQFNTVLPKVSGQGIFAMLKKYNETLEEALAEIDLTSTIQASHEIEILKQKLIDGIDDEDSIEAQIELMLKDTEEKHKQLVDFYNNTLNDSEYDNTVKEFITKSKDDIAQYLKVAKDETTEISTKIEHLDKFYVKIFGELNNDDKRIGGLKSELDSRINELDNFEKKQKTKYSTLISEIEGLLPSATSVGLAEAYNKERDNFKWPVRIWNTIFILSLIAMFITSYSTLKDIQDIADSGKHILQTLPIIAPLIWLAIFASKRRSENQRLEQEYAHKEALAKSYSSYKKQIEGLNEKDQMLLIKLLNSTIDTISHNASESLDKKHGDDMPVQDLLKTLISEIKK